MTPGTPITYLRTGRQIRGTGKFVEKAAGLTKVKPDRDDWKHIWLTAAEIEAGSHKPAPVKREKAEDAPEPVKRERKPKPAPVPLWKQHVDQVRELQAKHAPDEWPPVKMKFLSQMADELEAAQTLFQKTA